MVEGKPPKMVRDASLAAKGVLQSGEGKIETMTVWWSGPRQNRESPLYLLSYFWIRPCVVLLVPCVVQHFW